jgi:hypothetical protein
VRDPLYIVAPEIFILKKKVIKKRKKKKKLKPKINKQTNKQKKQKTISQVAKSKGKN